MPTAVAKAHEEGLIDAIADKLEGRRRRFLGLDAGGWTTLLFGTILTALAAFGAWQLHVRDKINDAASRDTVMVNGGRIDKLGQRVDQLDQGLRDLNGRWATQTLELQTTRESQVRLETLLEERLPARRRR